MKKNPLPRLDSSPEVRERLLSHCRLEPGEIWTDAVSGHRVGCLDATDRRAIENLMAGQRAQLAIHDPPYNLAAFELRSIAEFTTWCQQWVEVTDAMLDANSSLYVWLGADQNDGFQPLPDFMVMMRDQPFAPRSFITMRNQRGYGTQKNWMAVRQELLYYIKGKPTFNVDADTRTSQRFCGDTTSTLTGRKPKTLNGADRIRFGPAMCGLTFNKCFTGWRRTSRVATHRSP